MTGCLSCCETLSSFVREMFCFEFLRFCFLCGRSFCRHLSERCCVFACVWCACVGVEEFFMFVFCDVLCVCFCFRVVAVFVYFSDRCFCRRVSTRMKVVTMMQALQAKVEAVTFNMGRFSAPFEATGGIAGRVEVPR